LVCILPWFTSGLFQRELGALGLSFERFMGGNRSGSRARGYPSPFFKLSPRGCGPIAHKKGRGWVQNELVEILIGGVWLLRNVCGLNLLECMRSHDPRNAPHAPPPATLIPMTDFRFAIGKQRSSFEPLKNGSQLAHQTHLIRKEGGKKRGGGRLILFFC
jgi:hypothetical protein